MKITANEEYQRLIEIGESLLKSTDEHWHEIPVERMPIARFGQGTDAVFVAVGHLMLGRVSQARDWFAIAAQFFLEANKPADTVIAEKRALECALFCGDREYLLKVAAKIAPRQEPVKPVEYPYAMFLKHMILDEPAEAATFANESAWLSQATLKKRGGYGTLQAACQALIRRNRDDLRTGLDALLDEHQMKASHARTNLPDGMICFPGAALLILAHKQGLSVRITSPFLPVALLE